MVAGAPKEGEAVRKFFEFCGEDSVLVAHNASFDTEVIRSACERNGIEYNYSHIDTLVLAQSLISGIKNYKLDTISNHSSSRNSTTTGRMRMRARSPRYLKSCWLSPPKRALSECRR